MFVNIEGTDHSFRQLSTRENLIMGLVVICVPCADSKDFPEINDLGILLINLDRSCPSKHWPDRKDSHSRDGNYDEENGQDQPLSLSKNF